MKGTLLLLAVFIFPVEARARTYTIVRIVDGDTIVLPRLGPVRFIGIDTPEVRRVMKRGRWVGPERCGAEASAWLKARLAGKRVSLERHGHDYRGRILAYVFVGDSLLNLELVREGLAEVETRWRFSREGEFLAAQWHARNVVKRNLWGEGCKMPYHPSLGQ